MAEDHAWFGGRTYVDVGRSTTEKLCLVDCMANSYGNWKAEDGFRITFKVRGETDRDDDVLRVVLELPGVESLPTVSATAPATGNAVELSAIGLKMNCADIDKVNYVALEYADGTRYVVKDKTNHLDNSDYGLGSGEQPNMVMRYVFNRLVDPAQVTAVVVDGQRYEVG